MGEAAGRSFRLTQAAEGGRNGWKVQEGKLQGEEVIRRQQPPAFVYLSPLLFALFIRIINSRGQASSGVTALHFSQHKLSS